LILLVIGHAQSEAQQTVSTERAEMSAERRRFLQRLDHELKNPLTAIRAGLANLSWLPTEKERQDALASVEGQTLRLSRLAADLRKLADLETRSLERSPVQIADLLQEVIETARERPEAGQIHLSLSVPQAPWPLPVIQGDPDLLFLAVHNLVDNALKFTAAGDTVEIRASEDDETILIEVADTGPGIPENEIDHIWDELFRGQSARGIPGSGLGLALVRAIVERHGGRVSLRSRSGQGTLFTLRIPVN
jgi:two-component system OmpR family sensor kinase